MLEFIQKNIWLVLIATISGLMLLWSLVGRRFSGVNEVSTLQATLLINQRGAQILDIRDDKEFATAHLPFAKNIPLAQLKERMRELEKFKNRPIVVYCRNGTRAPNACSLLKQNGFTEVVSLKGGMIAWEQAGLPLQK